MGGDFEARGWAFRASLSGVSVFLGRERGRSCTFYTGWEVEALERAAAGPGLVKHIRAKAELDVGPASPLVSCLVVFPQEFYAPTHRVT